MCSTSGARSRTPHPLISCHLSRPRSRRPWERGRRQRKGLSVRRCGGVGRIRSGGEGKAGRSHTEAVPARRSDGSRRIGRIPAWIRGAAVDPAQRRRWIPPGGSGARRRIPPGRTARQRRPTAEGRGEAGRLQGGSSATSVSSTRQPLLPPRQHGSEAGAAGGRDCHHGSAGRWCRR